MKEQKQMEKQLHDMISAERKKMKEELREFEERYTSLFELAPDPVLTFNMKGTLTSANIAALRLGGYSKDEIVGKHLSKITGARVRDIPKYIKLLSSVVRGKIPEPFETTYTHKDGTIGWVEVHVGSLEVGGKRIGFQIIMRDITERKSMEAAKSHFISITTHELRTPLASIKGYTALIRSGRVGEVPKKIDELLEIVERNTNRLSNLTENLLDQQRIESGRLEISPNPIQLQEVVEEVVEEIQPFVSGKSQVLNVQVPIDLPLVNADRTRISQVIVNLLSNASKFTPKNRSINLQVKEAGEMIEVQVSDTGFGIEKEDISKLFTPFPDIQRPVIAESSVGLGLSICKGIVDLHGGKIWAESEGKGRGSTFTFTIPK